VGSRAELSIFKRGPGGTILRWLRGEASHEKNPVLQKLLNNEVIRADCPSFTDYQEA
jgi:hypothetical protein